MSLPQHTCKSCGNHFEGKYCNQCGEKVFTDHDKSVLHLFEEAFHFITHFEGKFFVTLKAFLSKPGKLSLDYSAGIRKKYFKPVSFFFILVILYLLFPRFEGLNMKLDTYTFPEYGYAGIALPLIKTKMKNKEMTYRQVAEKYDQKSPKISKLGLFLFLPFSALVLFILFYSKKRYFFDHFIAGTEITSFYIFSHFLFLPFCAFLVSKLAPGAIYMFDDGAWTWWVMLGCFALFIFLALKRIYRQAWWLTLLKSALFLFIFTNLIRYVYGLIILLLVMFFV